MAKRNKYYVVWVGRKTGIFYSWEDCKKSVEKFENAKYKSFDTLAQAQEAFTIQGYNFFYQKKQKPPLPKDISVSSHLPIIDALCTDAACSGNPGVMEYQGVYIKTGKRLFHFISPIGTNNIGEFLGIVHGLSYLKKHNYPQPLYTDSVNAMKWVRDKKCKTKLPLTPQTKELFDYIHRAEHWLKTNNYTTQILKWDTQHWGEIPADFNRK
ncbi:MAG: ribonuclease H family protein [Bacteroidota bacterium]|nr:ribonuclease H family protein [Bacteroidota bacterium]